MSKPHVKVVHSVPVKPSNNSMRVVMKEVRVFALFHTRESIRPQVWAPTVRKLAELQKQKDQERKSHK